MTSKPPFCAQQRSDTCMLACLRMILAHRGTQVTEAVLTEQVSLEESGLDPDSLVTLAERIALRAEARQLDMRAIDGEVEAGHYPIVLVDRSLLDRAFTIRAVSPVRITTHLIT